MRLQKFHLHQSRDDVGVLVGWAFCRTDQVAVMRWDAAGAVSLRFNHDQFTTAVGEMIGEAKKLCGRAGLSQTETRQRIRKINTSIKSFFLLGEQGPA